jgi:hypothetical protein
MKPKFERSFLVCFSFIALFLICIPSTVKAAMSSSDIQVTGVGSEAQGASIAFVNLDSNPLPDMILMAYDNTSGTKTFRYKIGWNVNTSGVASSWSPVYQVAGFGSEAQGAGIAIANLDSNSRPEIILMTYEKYLPGNNLFKYKIGWNVSTSGVASGWELGYPLSRLANLGAQLPEAQGADLVIYDINGDGKQDMVLMTYDNPVGLNYFRYMIRWDFMSDLISTKTTTDTGNTIIIDPTKPQQ